MESANPDAALSEQARKRSTFIVFPDSTMELNH
jgi:hypothetical protein